jgi:hypothetical protein
MRPLESAVAAALCRRSPKSRCAGLVISVFRLNRAGCGRLYTSLGVWLVAATGVSLILLRPIDAFGWIRNLPIAKPEHTWQLE